MGKDMIEYLRKGSKLPTALPTILRMNHLLKNLKKGKELKNSLGKLIVIYSLDKIRKVFQNQEVSFTVSLRAIRRPKDAAKPTAKAYE
jgi:hypothetical protein